MLSQCWSDYGDKETTEKYLQCVRNYLDEVIEGKKPLEEPQQ